MKGRGIDGFVLKLHRLVDGTKRDAHAPHIRKDGPEQRGNEVSFAAPKLSTSPEKTIIIIKYTIIIKYGSVAECGANAPRRSQAAEILDGAS
jgi:hypothetical protein